jgi:hypothetical protein
MNKRLLAAALAASLAGFAVAPADAAPPKSGSGCVAGDVLRYAQLPGGFSGNNIWDFTTTVDPQVGAGEVFVVQDISVYVDTGQSLNPANVFVEVHHKDLATQSHTPAAALNLLQSGAGRHVFGRPAIVNVMPDHGLAVRVTDVSGNAAHLQASIGVAGYYAASCQ